MKNANKPLFEGNTLKAKVTASLRLTVAVAVLFANAFFVRAQVSETSVRVNYPFDSAVLNTNYMSNSDALANLDQIAQEAIAAKINLDVVTFSSPEGNYTYNLRLSQQRAQTISDYLGSKYPGIGLNIVAGAESWDDLRNDVLTDTRLSENSRSQILEIIDSNNEPDSKEKLLKANSAYKTLYNNYFRGLRYANISLRIEKSAETATQYTTGENSVAAAETGSAVGEPIVYYSLNEDFIRPDYMGNAENLKAIRRILSNPANRQKELVLVGAASPEGPVSINDRLGIKRAQNLADWIVGQFPDMEGRIVIRSKGEDWAGLRAQVENCSALSAQDKEEILSIIDSDKTPVQKEAALKAHASYGIVEKECLPYIRYAKFGGFQPVKEDKTEETVEEPVLPIIENPEIQEETDSTAVVAPVQDSLAVDTPKVEQEDKIVKEEKVEEKPAEIVKPFVAVGTNILYDAILTPNFNAEFPIGNHWSVLAEYTFPWFVTPGNDRAWQMLKWDIEPRFWFKGGNRNAEKALTGLFVGLDLSAGYYDIEPRHKGYQGEFQLAGLDLGYSWKLNNNWRFNIAAGFGWMGTHYRYYEGSDDDAHLLYRNHGRIPWYFGPVKAEAGLKYLFTHTVKK